MRVDQVVDGDEIEARGEFFPESPFRKRAEQQHRRHQEK